MAKNSMEHNMKNEEFVELFGQKLKSIKVSLNTEKKEQEEKEEKKIVQAQNYVDYVNEDVVNDQPELDMNINVNIE